LPGRSGTRARLVLLSCPSVSSTAGGLLDEGVALARQVGDHQLIGAGLFWLGHLTMEEGDLGRARSLCEEALGHLHSIGHSTGHPLAQSLLGEISRREGDLARARGLIHATLSDMRSLGDVGSVQQALVAAAAVEIDSNQPAVAVRLLAAVYGVWRRAGFVRPFVYIRILHEQHLASARTALSAEAFAAAWAEGQAMTLEQAVAYAIADNSPPDEPTAEEVP
jgi:hypothetical protein